MIINTNGGFGSKSSGMQLDLLWENATPTEEFSQQTLMLGSGINLTNYKFIYITCTFNDAAGSNPFVECLYPTNTTHSCYIHFSGETDKIEICDCWRDFKISSNNKIYFGHNVLKIDSKYGPNNAYLIPYQIYGIK